MMYTVSEAGKLIKKIEEKIRRLLLNEEKTAIFNAASGEDVESLRPKYDFDSTQKEIENLQNKLRAVKHAINEFNITHPLPGFDGVTIDKALIMIPQIGKRAETLRTMAAHLPKERVKTSYMGSNIIDYRIVNYDASEVEQKYQECVDTLSAMQLALDKINTTETMEIDVELF